MKPARARAQLSRHLGMREVAKLFAEVETDPAVQWLDRDGEPTPTAIKRAKRRLRRAEQQIGERLVLGGGRRGKSGGGRCWTTWQALRRVGLVDDMQVLEELARDHMAEIRDDLTEQRECLDLLDARQRRLGKAVAGNQVQLRDLQAEVVNR